MSSGIRRPLDDPVSLFGVGNLLCSAGKSEQIYIYKPLENTRSFRLLKIDVVGRTRMGNPKPVDAYSHSIKVTITYSLVHVSIDNAPRYYTLSYAWGTSKRDHKLKLANGSVLRITDTLRTALPHVARSCYTEYVWIDQICINQEDPHERGRQVAIMGRIYRDCARVMVWLGLFPKDGAGNSGQRRNVRSSYSGVRHCFKTSSQTLRRHPADIAYEYRSEILDAPWFQRAWVFQEIILPSASIFIFATNIYDPKSPSVASISLEELWRVSGDHSVLEPGARGQERTATKERINYIVDQFGNFVDGVYRPIEQILSHMTPSAQTSEQLDRLYAFFGLHMGDFDLTPSYDVTFEQAMIATATSIIKGMKRLDIFEVTPRNAILNSRTMPSWAPDFRFKKLVAPFAWVEHEYFGHGRPYDWYDWTGRFTDENALHVSGQVIDRVSSKFDKMAPDSGFEALRHLLEAATKLWDEHVASHACDPVHPRPTIIRLLTSLWMEGHVSGLPNYPGAHWIGELAAAVTDASSPFAMQWSITQIQAMLTNMAGRDLWFTENAAFACGSELQSGDAICILHGASNPVALRPTEQGTWLVMGSCYLEGWMNPWYEGKVDWKEGEGEEFVLV